MRPARRADNSDVMVVSVVKVRTEAQHFIHDLLREGFTVPLPLYVDLNINETRSVTERRLR